MPAHAVSAVPTPDEVTALHELRADIDRMLRGLTPKEALIVRRYYGFEGDGCSYDELGRQLNVSGERIRQILARALRKLRHPQRCRILEPHVVFRVDPAAARAAKEAEAEEAEGVRQRLELERREEERRVRQELHRRIGEEIGTKQDSWWSDERRRMIAATLDLVTHEVVTEVHSTDEAHAYIRKHFDHSWHIYAAWKRDVRRRVSDGPITFTCGFLPQDGCLIYVRNNRCTWYLFNDPPYPLSGPRWIGYVEIGDAAGSSEVARD